jgi:hypothetical protein
MDSQLRELFRRLDADPEDEMVKTRLVSLLCRMGLSGKNSINGEILEKLFEFQHTLDQPIFTLEETIIITGKKEERDQHHYMYGHYDLTYKNTNFPGRNRISVIDIRHKENTIKHSFKNGKGRIPFLALGPSFWRFDAEFPTLGLEIKLKRIGD